MQTPFQRRTLRNAVVLATLGLFACGGGDGGAGGFTSPFAVAASVVVSPSNASIPIGATTVLTAVARDVGGNVVTRSITWSSSNSAVATVSSGGIVTGVAEGTISIYAEADAVSGEATIVVPPVAVASLTLAPVSPLVPAETVAALAVTRDATGTVVDGRAIDWTSAADSIAVVNDDGLITAVGVGTTRITATSEGVSDSVAVHVDDGGFITSSGGTVTAADGDVVLLVPSQAVAQGTALRVTPDTSPPPHPHLVAGTAYVVEPSDTQFAQDVLLRIRYASLGAGVTTGQLRLHRWDGTAWVLIASNVMASLREVSGPIARAGLYGILETQDPVAEVFVTPASATLTVHETRQMTARVLGSIGQTLTDRAVTWSSSNDAVASVSASGLVTAVSAGPPVTIQATSEGISGIASITVNVPLTYASLAAGYQHSCGLRSDNAAWCWGRNSACELGTGGCSMPVISPVAAQPTRRFSQIVTGEHFTCGILVTGETRCWGDNAFGTLGTGTFAGSTLPVAPVGGHVFVTLSAGAHHVCGLTASGSAYCWGENVDGSLGDSSDLRRNAPSKVSGGLIFVSITTGREHTCALTAAGGAYCWGDNVDGALGDNTFQDRDSPRAVAGGHTFTTLAAGEWHTCGITAAAETWCWGWNEQGQLGDGSTINRGQPVRVAGGDVFTDVFPAGWTTCGLLASGAAKCWGDGGDGQIGDGANTDRLLPTPVSGSHTFTMLTSGLAYHYCGIRTDGVALCWGMNATGQLGIGTMGNALTPIELPVPQAAVGR